MERTITLTGIYAKFTKNFDTFGKMVNFLFTQQPFLTFKLGSLIQKTQVSQAGLQPVWKATITLKATKQSEIQITAYDQDLTENEYMGKAKLNIDTLKASGNHSVTITEEDGKSIGDVFFSYQIQQPKAALPNSEVSSQSNIQKSVEKKFTVVQPQVEKSAQKQHTNSIKITSISAKFTKNFDTFGKMQPFLVFKLEKSEDKTEIYKDSKDDVKWAKNINLGFDKETDLEIKGYDEDMTENEYMGISTVNLKSLSKSGKHTVQMLGEDTKSIGTISFNYQITGLFPDEKTAPVQKAVAQPKPQVIEKPQTKPIQPAKVQQKAKIEAPVRQEIKPVLAQEQIDFSQKRLDKKQRNLNNSINQNSQMNKSRDSFKLPFIGDVAKNYGDKIYEKQSSSTLQKSILVYSMPKASRFNSGPKYAGEPSYYVDSCFKPNITRGTGFGFGAKRQFPEWLERNMKENPAPGAYFEQPKSSQVRSRGPTFGISHKHYEKVTIPKEKSPQRTIKSNPRLKAILKDR